LRNPKTLKSFGQAREMDVDVLGDRAMGFQEKAVDGEPGTGECRQSNN